MSPLKIASFISIFGFISCNSNEIGNSKDVNPESIFLDYKIWGEESEPYITCKFQFRFGGVNGTTLILEQPSKVELDGELLPVDSAKFDGAYYEIQKPLDSFRGKHSIVFTDLNNKQYKEEFRFEPFILKTRLPDVISRDNLAIDITGLEPVDYLRIIATDTSFNSDDINEIDTVRYGRLILSKDRLKNLVNGPISFQLYQEEEKPVNATREGGKISISYVIKREFDLRD